MTTAELLGEKREAILSAELEHLLGRRVDVVEPEALRPVLRAAVEKIRAAR